MRPASTGGMGRSAGLEARYDRGTSATPPRVRIQSWRKRGRPSLTSTSCGPLVSYTRSGGSPPESVISRIGTLPTSTLREPGNAELKSEDCSGGSGVRVAIKVPEGDYTSRTLLRDCARRSTRSRALRQLSQDEALQVVR